MAATGANACLAPNVPLSIDAVQGLAVVYAGSSGFGVIQFIGDIRGGRILVQVIGLGAQDLPLLQIDRALTEQIVGDALQVEIVSVGGLLPVGLIVEQALPGVEVWGLQVVAHG